MSLSGVPADGTAAGIRLCALQHILDGFVHSLDQRFQLIDILAMGNEQLYSFHMGFLVAVHIQGFAHEYVAV